MVWIVRALVGFGLLGRALAVLAGLFAFPAILFLLFLLAHLDAFLILLRLLDLFLAYLIELLQLVGERLLLGDVLLLRALLDLLGDLGTSERVLVVDRFDYVGPLASRLAAWPLGLVLVRPADPCERAHR